jgi:hypothetical protein
VNSSNAQTPKLRWFQFRLRTIFTVVTIVAVQCAVCFPMLREWKSRTAVFEKLRQVGFALHNYEGYNSQRRYPHTNAPKSSELNAYSSLSARKR